MWGGQVFLLASGTTYSPVNQSESVAVPYCPLQVKIQPDKLGKDLHDGLAGGSCCAARAHYLDLAVTCCGAPVWQA